VCVCFFFFNDIFVLSLFVGFVFFCVFFFFLMIYLSILMVKDYEHKALTSQNIKLCKIIATGYKVT
jgi:hypothetical protein